MQYYAFDKNGLSHRFADGVFFCWVKSTGRLQFWLKLLFVVLCSNCYINSLEIVLGELVSFGFILILLVLLRLCFLSLVYGCDVCNSFYLDLCLLLEITIEFLNSPQYVLWLGN